MVINTAKNFSSQKAENIRSQADIMNAYRASSYDLSALSDQLRQEQQASDLKVFERQRQALRDQSRIMASAGEAGVGGNTILRTIANQQWDLAHDTGIYRTNLDNKAFMATQQAHGVLANLDNRVNTAEARIKNPWLGVALSIPSQAYGLYEAYQGGKTKG